MLCDSEPKSAKSFEQLSLDSFLPKNEVHLFCIYCSMLPDTDPALRGTFVPFLLHLTIFAFVSVQKFDPLWSELS